MTDLPVRGRAEAIEKINWYAMRWKIEMFHKVLKSGCQAEASTLRTAERLANLMSASVFSVARVLWLTMLARAEPEASPSIAFTDNEIALLDRLLSDAGNRRAKHGGSASTSSSSLDWAAMSQGPQTDRLAASLSGVASRASPISR